MKINRRDYLKRMGAAGVFAGTAGLEVFAHEYSEPQRSCPTDCPEPEAPLVWQPIWCEDLPRSENPHVKLIFEGLAGFARRKEGNKFVCTVGFHSKGDSPIHHNLSISAYNNAVNDNRCDHVHTTPHGKKIKKIQLEVRQPKIVDQTFFYQRGRARTRQDLVCDEDWRWIVDFESDYLYGKHLEKYKNIYKPTLRVPSGIFYTLRKTASTFRAQTEDGQYVRPLSNVADILGANIYVESRSYVKLIIDDDDWDIYPPGEIYFKNHCMQDNDDDEEYCKFNPYNLKDKKKRSDFFLNHKAFDRNGAPEYQLYLVESHDQTKIPDVICEKARLVPKKANDESPCSGAGYGKGDPGLPYP